MRKATTLSLGGSEYVVVERAEYERLDALARVARLSPLRAARRRLHVPAAEYARASIAREVVARRAGAGLSQRELAKLARIRVETLCRIETGKHTASTQTIAKLDRALKDRESRSKARRRGA